MGEPSRSLGSNLTREQIVRALQGLSDELGKLGVTGELCLFGGTVMAPYLVESLFEEGNV